MKYYEYDILDCQENVIGSEIFTSEDEYECIQYLIDECGYPEYIKLKLIEQWEC